MKDFLNLEISLCINIVKQYDKDFDQLLQNIEENITQEHFITLTDFLNRKLQKLKKKINEKLERKIQNITQQNNRTTSLRLNKNYCINLTDQTIPDDILEFLGLGMNFSLPLFSTNKEEMFNLRQTHEM